MQTQKITRRTALTAGAAALAGAAFITEPAEAQTPSGFPRFYYGDASAKEGDGIASIALDGRTLYPAISLGNGRGFVLLRGRATPRRGEFYTRLSRVIGSDRGEMAGVVAGEQIEGNLFSSAFGEGEFSADEFPFDFKFGPDLVGFWTTERGSQDFAQLELTRRGSLRAAGTVAGLGRFSFSGRWSPLVVEIAKTARANKRLRPLGVAEYSAVGWLPSSTSVRGLDPIFFPGVPDPLGAVLDPDKGVLFLAVGYSVRDDETIYVPLVKS